MKPTRWTGPLAALTIGVIAGLTGAAGTATAGAEIPDAVLLQPDDLYGAQPTPGGPDTAVHPLPPQPCPDAPTTTPVAARTVQAVVQAPGSTYRQQIYEYVARYEPGVAARVAEDLRDRINRCGTGPEGVRHRIVSNNLQGPHSMVLWREYQDGDRMDAYAVGVAGDYLVVVLDTGWGPRVGDLTSVSGWGAAAVRRAGGDPAAPGAPDPTPTTAPTTRWVTTQADVTAVRRGPDGDALVELRVPAGGPDCAREPRATNVTEEGDRVHANLVSDALQDDAASRCVERTGAAARLTVSGPLGNRALVLNQEEWTPHGDGYRRCHERLGCTPPADRCDRAWVDEAVWGWDIPRRSHLSVRGCDGAWMVLDIDTSAGDCGPVDPRPRPDCTVEPRRLRHAMRFDDGWSTVSRARGAGCAGILATVPDFPEALCRDLPAI